MALTGNNEFSSKLKILGTVQAIVENDTWLWHLVDDENRVTSAILIYAPFRFDLFYLHLRHYTKKDRTMLSSFGERSKEFTGMCHVFNEPLLQWPQVLVITECLLKCDLTAL